MNNEATVTMRQMLREKRRQNCGARTRNERRLRRQAIKFGEH